MKVQKPYLVTPNLLAERGTFVYRLISMNMHKIARGKNGAEQEKYIGLVLYKKLSKLLSAFP